MRRVFEKQWALLISILLMSSTTIAGGPGEIQGKVFDNLGTPLYGAYVWVEIGDRKVGTTTDFDGKYIIKPLDAGTYNIQYSFTGFTPKTITGVQVISDKIRFIDDITLSMGVDLTVVDIEGWVKPIIDIDNPTMTPITAKELQKLPSSRNIANSIAAMMGGVYQSDAGQPLYFRGSRSGASAYFVDGVKSFSSDMGVPSVAVGEVVVYTSGIPAKYGDITGGVIAVETKGYFSVYNEIMRERKRNEIIGK